MKLTGFFSNFFKKFLDSLGVYVGVAVGVALILGANGFALACVPIAVVAVPIASAGTLVGTLVCAKALFRLRKQDVAEEVNTEVESRLETERLRRERDEVQKENQKLKEENGHLRRQGMNAIEFNPELKLTFLSMNYKKYDFYEEVMDRSDGKKGTLSDDDPYETKYQGVYYIEGQLDYEIDLSKLNVVCEDNTLIFCGDIQLEVKPLLPKKKEVVLKQMETRVWDFKKGKSGNRGKEKKCHIEDKKNESASGCEPQKKQEERLNESLTQSSDDYVKNFEGLAKKYLENIFKMTGMEIQFNRQKKGSMSLGEFIAQRNREIKAKKLEASDALAIL